MEKIKTLARKASQRFGNQKDGSYQKMNDATDVPPVPDIPSGSKGNAESLRRLLYSNDKIKSNDAKKLFKESVQHLKGQFQGLEATPVKDGGTFGQQFDRHVESTLKNHDEMQMRKGLELDKGPKYSAQAFLQERIKQMKKNVDLLNAHVSGQRDEGTSSRRPEA